MRKGIKQGGFPWGVTLALAFLLVLPAFIGSIPVAAAGDQTNMWVEAANTGYGAETSYIVEFMLQEGLSLGPGDTVSINSFSDPVSERDFDFSMSEATITITDQVYGSNCEILYGGVGELSFEIGDDFSAGTGSCLNIFLDDVSNPRATTEYEEWYWELSINGDDDKVYRSNPIGLYKLPQKLRVLIDSEIEVENGCLDMYVEDAYYQELRLELMAESNEPGIWEPVPAPFDLYLTIHELRDGVRQEDVPPNFWLQPSECEWVEYTGENLLYIPQGEESVSVWYRSTEANGYLQGYDTDSGEPIWSFYDETEIGIVFEVTGLELEGTEYQLRVFPGFPSLLVAKISDEGPKIVNWEGDDYYPSLPGVPEGDLVDDLGVYHIKPEHRYELSIGLTDYYGNPTVDPEDTIEVALYSDSFEGDGTLKFYEDCDSTAPIDYIEIEPGTIWKTVCLEYTAAQEDAGLVICSCSRLETGTELEVIVENPEAAGLTVYLLDIYNPMASIPGELWRTGQALVWDKQPTPCIVAVVDENGYPTVWNGPGDMPVTLQASEGFLAVSADLDALYHGLNMTIPEGCAGVGLYYVRPQPTDNPEDADLLTATAGEQEGLGVAYMEVDLYPEWIRLLYPGWNVVSTPVALERARLDQYISQMDVDEEVGLMGIMNGQDLVEAAYTFDPVGKAWHQIYQVPYVDSMNPKCGQWVVQQGSTPDYDTDPVFLFEPMKAVYVKIKPNYLAALTCYPLSTGTGPYTESLKSGWNLVGPAIDISNHPHPLLPAGEKVHVFIDSIYSKCLQVVDKIPGYLDELWIYTPGDEADLEEDEIPFVLAGGGVWIYMGEEAELQGTSYTPVQRQPFLQ